jgi:hypothetical protein
LIMNHSKKLQHFFRIPKRTFLGSVSCRSVVSFQNNTKSKMATFASDSPRHRCQTWFLNVAEEMFLYFRAIWNLTLLPLSQDIVCPFFPELLYMMLPHFPEMFF